MTRRQRYLTFIPTLVLGISFRGVPYVICQYPCLSLKLTLN